MKDLTLNYFSFNSYNPFIYCYLNSSFRNAAKKLYQLVLCKRQTAVTRTKGNNTFTTNINAIEMIETRKSNQSENESNDNIYTDFNTYSEVQTLCEEETFTIQRAITDIVNNQAGPLQAAINTIAADCAAFVTR